MPTVPTVQPRGEMGVLGRPGPTPGQFIGAGLSNLGETLTRLQDGYDRSEASAVVSRTSAEFKKAIQETDFENTDPEIFQSLVASKLDDLREKAIGSAKNQTQQRHIRAGLANNVIEAQIDVNQRVRQKQFDRVRTNLDVTKQATRDILLTSKDPREKERAIFNLGNAIGNAAGNGFITSRDARNELQKFFDDVKADEMNLEASSRPHLFEEKLDRGDYRGIDSTKIENASNIAERVIRQRDTKEAQINDAIGRRAFNAFLEQAMNHKLDVEKFETAAGWYKYSFDNVVALKRMNLGLRESSPHSELLLNNAVSPVMAKRDEPNLGDVEAAIDNLLTLVAKGLVSPDSVEYQRKWSRMQAIRDRLTTKSKSDLDRARSAGRRRIRQLHDEFRPDMDEEERRQIIGQKSEDIEGLTTPQAIQEYVNRLEGDLQQKNKKRDEWRPSTEGLRNLQPR